jgi:hypothetical protein
MQWVERHHRFLKNHRDFIAAHLAQGFLAGMQQAFAMKEDIALRIDCRRVGSRRRIDNALTLLPEPDSPTSASVSPASICSESESTTVRCVSC